RPALLRPQRGATAGERVPLVQSTRRQTAGEGHVPRQVERDRREVVDARQRRRRDRRIQRIVVEQRVGREGGTSEQRRTGERRAVFRNAYATTSWTNPSVASLFTSRYPSQHQVTTFFARLSPEEVNVVAKLDPLGYLGGGFSANFGVADQVGRALGFRSCHAYHTNKPKLRAAPVIEAGLAWVDRVRRRAPRRPLFLYFQFMEPHF